MSVVISRKAEGPDSYIETHITSVRAAETLPLIIIGTYRVEISLLFAAAEPDLPPTNLLLNSYVVRGFLVPDSTKDDLSSVCLLVQIPDDTSLVK